MTQTEHLLEELRNWLEALPDPSPAFDLHVGLAAEYDQLLGGDLRKDCFDA